MGRKGDLLMSGSESPTTAYWLPGDGEADAFFAAAENATNQSDHVSAAYSVWEEARNYFDSATGKTGEEPIKVGEGTVSFYDLGLRRDALSFATANSAGEQASSIVSKAEAFLKFLQGGAQS